MTPTKIVELVIADDSQELAIDAISLVTSPAIEQDFVYFGKEKNNLTFAKVDEEKRMLVSPALIPNKQIFRHDPNTDSDYYVYFSPDTVRKASELYLKHNNHHKATYQHQDRVSGVLTVESWIKEGELKGLSIEGYFTNKFEQMNKKEFTTEEVKTALKELLKPKLSKVKKINFNTQKELFDLLDKFWKDFDKAVLPFEKVEGTLKGMIKSAEKAKTTAKEYIKKADQFNKQIKELGVSEKEAKAGTYIKQKQEDIKSADNWIRVIKKFIADANNVD